MDPENETSALSEDTQRMAALGRANREGTDLPTDTDDTSEQNADASAEGEASTASEGDERPEWLPEKFKSAEDLAKAYAELERKNSQPKEADEGASEDDGESEGDDPPAADSREAFTTEVQSAVEAAQTEYAESGELTADTRKALDDLLGPTYVDNYLAGVAALEANLTQSVYAEAGGEEAYKSAIEWAKENWSESKATKFDNALNDPELRPMMVKSLMDDFRSANPGEGKFTEKGSGIATSDVYTDKDEFLRDLAAADEADDRLARKKATQKLERSKKAGTLKGITPRTGLSRYN